MKKISVIVVLFLLLSGYISASGFLRANGQKIVNNEGEVLLRGIGLGGWLLQEGYMLQTSEFANAEHEIRERIQSVIGEELTNDFYKYYHDNFIVKDDIDIIKKWGFNSIRLPFSYKILTPENEPGVYLEEGFERIDKLLDWCKANELYLILDMHACPGGQSDEPISDYDPAKPSLWESEQNKQRTVDLWVKLAERYKDEEWIGGYDLINEPKWDLGAGNVPLRELYIRITDAIREVDTNHLIFVEGNWFATDFSGLTPPWDDNMAYSFHKYWNENNQGSIQGYLDIRSRYNVPLWLGESGENSNAWFTKCISLLEENDIGWAWWPLKKIESIAGPLSADMTLGYQRLLNYWKGQGSKPGVQEGYDYLVEQVDNLKLGNCTFRPDVIDAMIRQVKDPTNIPFKEHNLPGRIFCTDYDMGPYNSAYLDADYQNTGGDNTTYNSGYSYRNDGVDIEECEDVITNGYNVGWTDSGEYLKYTVNVEEDAVFNIKLRYAANEGNGKIIVYLDNNNFIPMTDLQSTGGWANWFNLDFGDYVIPEGKHTIMIKFFFGGFNVNYLEFTQKATDVKTGDAGVHRFGLEQNYPNPFNGITNIQYSLPEKSEVTLHIYDSTGQKVNSLVNREQGRGTHKIAWNTAGLASGIYYYTLKTSAGFTETKKALLLK